MIESRKAHQHIFIGVTHVQETHLAKIFGSGVIALMTAGLLGCGGGDGGGGGGGE